ncbi:MAG: peptide-methionine (R)-S-oxide reductase [Verrucomicrobiales bacterium]|jgi:peptide-methionine (R)-S-oxide reductase
MFPHLGCMLVMARNRGTIIYPEDSHVQMKAFITPLLAMTAALGGIVAYFSSDLSAEADETNKGGKTIMEVSDSTPVQPEKIVEKSEEEWKKLLTDEQFRILREAGTERASGEVYHEFKEQGAGTYYCAGCDAELFTSNEKFDSRCGWPSFYDPSKAKNVKTNVDFHLGYARTEVLCAKCNGHLGHVFSGEGFATPTDKRYCINGTVLKFVPARKAAAASEEKGSKDAAATAEKSDKE